jgi:hypothetical protein
MRLPVHSLVAVLGMGMGALAQEPPRGPDITYITWSGSGCPSASVATQVGTVQKGGTVLFSSIEADLDPKVPGDEESTDCSVAVSISSIPAGYQVVFQSLIWRGYMLLREGATGTHTISSTWLNNPCETVSFLVLIGFCKRNFSVDHSINHLLSLEPKEPPLKVWRYCVIHSSANLYTPRSFLKPARRVAASMTSSLRQILTMRIRQSMGLLAHPLGEPRPAPWPLSG